MQLTYILNILITRCKLKVIVCVEIGDYGCSRFIIFNECNVLGGCLKLN